MNKTLREECKKGKVHIFKEQGKWVVNFYGSYFADPSLALELFKNKKLAIDYVFYRNRDLKSYGSHLHD